MPELSRRESCTGRFLDPANLLQTIPDHEKGFESTIHYKHVSQLISLQFSKILQILHYELNNNLLYFTTWKKAKEHFMDKRKLDTLPVECCLAIITYTMDEKINGTKLYLDFNEKCRRLGDDGTWQSFPYKSLYALLTRSIHTITNNPDVTTPIYYRGLKCKITDIKEGDYVYSAQFLSCTTDKQVALEFIGGSDEDTQGTLMVFEGSAMAACGIMDYSAFKEEQEILVFPWSTFKVTKIITGGSQDQIFLKTIGPFIATLPYSGTYIKKGVTIQN
ncbi:hypothetical protein Zmor_010226 [Zophobas morio]|uniref:NAD(P)(+)--arginine ADP-ribosyltransferase n=1 Tax=Zophobas morio TaxID=2755281 RepID=A0AA38MJH6_9CUCU|nr:hypothetical protein Zmor_010226 [Zophobas morio]